MEEKNTLKFAPIHLAYPPASKEVFEPEKLLYRSQHTGKYGGTVYSRTEYYVCPKCRTAHNSAMLYQRNAVVCDCGLFAVYDRNKIAVWESSPKEQDFSDKLANANTPEEMVDLVMHIAMNEGSERPGTISDTK